MSSDMPLTECKLDRHVHLSASARLCSPTTEPGSRADIKELVAGALHHSDLGDHAVFVDVHPEDSEALHTSPACLDRICREIFLPKHRQHLFVGSVSNFRSRCD